MVSNLMTSQGSINGGWCDVKTLTQIICVFGVA